MKIRKGFVSNSSSSSFVIHKYYLSNEQIEKIRNYVKVVEEYLEENPLSEDDCEKPEFDFSYCDWGWGIKEFDDFILGETSMDNFDFEEFFKFINVDINKVCWDEGYIAEPTARQNSVLNGDRQKVKKLKRKEKLERLDDGV